MKYLWIALFEDSQGKVPIFLELRRLNDITSDDLLPFIYDTVVESHAHIEKSRFNDAVAKGLFAFVFNGFDEIAIEKREKLEREILALAHNNPENIVAVSGLTDDRFSSWQSFYKFNVQPLSKQSVIDLLEKLDYDSAIKKKFISRVKLDLYDKHESFLSTPLLSTLMLMTFNQFADIPEKIHIFL